MFKKTGTNVVVAFFEKKSRPSRETQVFEALKFSSTKENEDVLSKTRNYRLVPDYNYRAGADFEVFIEKRKVSNPLKYKYYLKQKEIDAHPGNEEISLIDANNYEGTQYARIKRKVSKEFAKKIRKNKLWVRTVDTGLWEGRAGLYLVDQNFDVEGILVTKNTYRTNPIQLFFKTEISPRMQVVLKDYVNSVLEHLRAITDSEFMTTYKYSNHDYIRKYFGLRQLRKIISTFPYHSLENGRLEEFKEIVKKRGVKEILTYLDSLD